MAEWSDINTKRYYEFLNNIIESRGQWSISDDEYYEGHHIIPKSFGGEGRTRFKDDNIIRLYAREHFEAHKILAEDNPDVFKIVSAWTMMAFPKSDTLIRDFEITSQEYEEIRTMFGNIRRNREVSDETKKKLSKSLTGRKMSPFTEEHKKKLSESNRHAHKITEEGLNVLKTNSSRYLNSLSDEEYRQYCKKCSDRTKGTKWFTDGVKDIRARVCPDGFRPGRSKTDNLKGSKGKHFYNNGVVNVLAYECPDGFIKGRIIDQSKRSRDTSGRFCKNNIEKERKDI